MDRQKTLLDVSLAEARAGIVGESVSVPIGTRALTVHSAFAYGSGGTSAKAYVQTTFDGGANWVDIMCFAYTTTAAKTLNSVRVNTVVAANYTPTDATLSDNTIKDGLLGDRIRVKYTTTGTYAGTSSLKLSAVFA